MTFTDPEAVAVGGPPLTPPPNPDDVQALAAPNAGDALQAPHSPATPDGDAMQAPLVPATPDGNAMQASPIPATPNGDDMQASPVPPATPNALPSQPSTPDSALPTRPSTPEVSDGDGARFTTVLQALGSDSNSPLRCGETLSASPPTTSKTLAAPDALKALRLCDVYAFRRDSPRAMARLQMATAEAMARLDAGHAYRAVALYVALLLQDVDLQTTQGAGPLHRDAAGRVCRRLGAAVQQAMAARDARLRCGAVPAYYRPLAIAALTVAGVLLAVLALLVATAAAGGRWRTTAARLAS